MPNHDMVLKMKILYTILFFLSALLLIFLMFDLLQMIDSDINEFSSTFILGVAILILGIVLSIGLLAFALLRFLKTPPSDEDA